MTAVVGLLNKNGVAIAADSAVSRNRNNEHKVTKNGNKMLRLSNVVQISVMTTGNANFIGNPWDVVIRHYRKYRGDEKHETVEACMNDFFNFIAEKNLFWDDKFINEWVKEAIKITFYDIEQDLNKSGSRIISKEFMKKLKGKRKKIEKDSTSLLSDNRESLIENFKKYAKTLIDNHFDELLTNKESDYSQKLFEDIRKEFELTLFERLTRRWENHRSAILVFSGFGASQEYPSLVSACVCEGFDHHINYYKDTQIEISDEKPVAYCPFAQNDVMNGIIRGQHKKWLTNIEERTHRFFRYDNVSKEIFKEKLEEDDYEFLNMLYEVKHNDLDEKLCKDVIRLLNKNQKEWEKTLKDYDLKAMADLALSLIDLTGFQRILTFQEEGVGGPVDVAVISKNDGFTWLSRKSWYHHKDVNGNYGTLGI